MSKPASRVVSFWLSSAMILDLCPLVLNRVVKSEISKENLRQTTKHVKLIVNNAARNAFSRVRSISSSVNLAIPKSVEQLFVVKLLSNG